MHFNCLIRKNTCLALAHKAGPNKKQMAHKGKRRQNHFIFGHLVAFMAKHCLVLFIFNCSSHQTRSNCHARAFFGFTLTAIIRTWTCSTLEKMYVMWIKIHSTTVKFMQYACVIIVSHATKLATAMAHWMVNFALADLNWWRCEGKKCWAFSKLPGHAWNIACLLCSSHFASCVTAPVPVHAIQSNGLESLQHAHSHREHSIGQRLKFMVRQRCGAERKGQNAHK